MEQLKAAFGIKRDLTEQDLNRVLECYFVEYPTEQAAIKAAGREFDIAKIAEILKRAFLFAIDKRDDDLNFL